MKTKKTLPIKKQRRSRLAARTGSATRSVSFTILGSYWLDTSTGIKSAIRNFYQEKQDGKTKPKDVRL